MNPKINIAAIIPARMGSSRFPGKPLIPILGLPMIEHVRRRVERIPLLQQVYVATCDEEIRKVVEGFGGKVIMTASTHERATDRIEEAARQLKADVVVNVQGDEPMVSAQSLEQLVTPYLNGSDAPCTCLVYPIRDPKELSDLNIVKVVLSHTDRILYLSRAAIPGKAYDPAFRYYKQSGLMAFTKTSLHRFTQLDPTPLEAKESVDLLRLLEHNSWIQGVVTPHETKGVDVPDQVAQLEKAILSDPEQKALFESIRKG